MPKGNRSPRKKDREKPALQAVLLPTMILALELLKLIAEIAVIIAAFAR